MEHNVLTHYVVDVHGSPVPLIPVTTTPTFASAGSVQTPSALPRQQVPFPQVAQQNQLETHVTIINLEQCCICSVMYECMNMYDQRRPGPIPQPDLNRMVSKVLDVLPEPQFFRSYLPFCANCISLLRKFDKLRVELEFVKTQLVTYVIDSLTQVRAEGGSQLEGLKAQILSRWTSANSTEDCSRKRGFSASADGKSGELSWAAYNNLTKSSTVVEPVENWSVDSEITVEATGAGALVADNRENLQEEGGVVLPATDGDSQSDSYNVDDNDTEPTVKPFLPRGIEEAALDLSHLKVTSGESIVKARPKRKHKLQGDKKSQGIEQEVTALICTNCGRTYGNGMAYNAHAQVCNSDDLNMEKICPICTEGQQESCIFETWNDFNAHVEQQHPLVKLEVCQFCKLRFLPFGIKHHKCIQKYKGQQDQEAIFKCDQCGKAYNFRANLTDHVRRSHKDQKHTCDMCGKTYGSPMLLKLHIERHKSVVTKFKCDVCGVCLSSNYSLKEHTKRHKGEQPFNCTICSKKFSSRTIFTAHQMVHTDQKPHICLKCGKGFKLRGTMKRHFSRHLLYETKYTKRCPLCPNSVFRKVWVLKKHMTAEHPGSAELKETLEKYKDIDDTPSFLRANPARCRKGKRKLSTGNAEDGKGETKASNETEMSPPPPINPPGSPGTPRHSTRLMKKSVVSATIAGKSFKG